ncbi:MAG TPA: L-histidine N(alpha)-methyltransferase [Wenzhouxiangella sp.]|nr:L-histidine N(alpha)-methyltransferase [Wenzhouxiangella sp.]
MTEQDNSVQLRSDVLEGLGRQPRSTPSKYLYDARGSELFEQITRLKEYYVTRADLALHRNCLPEISDRVGPQAHIIELGSGAGTKTRLLLQGLNQPRAYTPIEISAAALEQSAKALAEAFPNLLIHPLEADYTAPIPKADLRLEPPARRRVVYFPGSTIGNFDPPDAVAFMKRLRNMMGADGALIVGIDLIKPRPRLIAAYDDSEGVTAAFNLNLLARLKREINAEVDINAFRHEARWNDKHKRIEMHLVAATNTAIVIDDKRFEFRPGESIHTESSYKYTADSFAQLASQAGLRSDGVWYDPDRLFSTHWLVPADRSDAALAGRVDSAGVG